MSKAPNKLRFIRNKNNKTKGLKIAKAIDDFLTKNILTEPQKVAILKYKEDLNKCSVYSLFRVFQKDSTYLHSLTCKHKLCPLCNADRKTRIRGMYRKFFENNGNLVQDYDFMHLTLTVPHTAQGWKGQKVYNKEILKCFNLLRKYPFWKENVYAGEYTVEFTKMGKTLKGYDNVEDIANGLHIHIHALLLVHKKVDSSGKNTSRNDLYKNVLKAWNSLTISQGAKRKSFSAVEIAGIKRSLLGKEIYYATGPRIKELTSFADKFVKSLSPQGSTFVNLENLYKLGKDGKKYRCKADNPESFMRGIMECLKYHFEPVTIYSNETGYDVELIMDMLPLLYKQRLYGKFGKFYGDKRLNINFESETGLDEISDSMNEEILDPDTGTPAQATDYDYKVYSLSHAYLDQWERIRFSKEAKVNLIGTFTDVFSQMKQIIKPIVIGQSQEKKQKIAMKIAELNYLLDTETGEIVQILQENE